MPTLPSAEKAQRENLSFRDRLMRLRKAYDVFPWIEPYKKAWTLTSSPSDPPQTHTFQHKQPRSLFISEITHNNYGNGVHDNGNWSTGLVPWEVQLTRGVSQEALSSAPVLSDQLLGSTLNLQQGVEIKRFPTGLRIPENEVFSVIARSPPDGRLGVFAKAYEHNLYIGFRGYQLFKKGTNVTPQFTYSEYAKQGYTPTPYNPVLTAGIPNDSSAEVVCEFTLPELHAVDFITLRFNNNSIAAPCTLMVKLEPPANRPMMDSHVNCVTLGSVANKTAWYFPQPLSCPKGGIWRMRVYQTTPANWQGTINFGSYPRLDVTLHGHNLIRRG